MLIDPRCINAALSIVSPDDFSDKLCKIAVEAIKELRGEGKTIDAVLVYERARAKNSAFTAEFAKECMQVCGTAQNIEEYCRLIKAAANAERLMELADSVNEKLYARESAEAVISDLRRSLDEIEPDNASVISSASAANVWQRYAEMVKADPESAYCKTGYHALDTVLGGGMFRSGLYIVGARPGMGKTTLGISIAENIATSGKAVLFISLEMGAVQIMSKRLARATQIGYTKLMTGNVSEEENEHILQSAAELSERPFYLSDKSLCRLADIESMAHAIKDLQCIVVDYFGLLTADESEGVRSRYEETTELSKGLKSLAKRLNIPLLVLCQLNRENGTRSDKRPKLSDLRDTGALEQDADCVILLHREEYYLMHDENHEKPELETIELNVAKNRHGETQCVKMLWQGTCGGINEMENRYDEPYDKGNNAYDDYELPF